MAPVPPTDPPADLPVSPSDTTTQCPGCGATTTGKFCSNCGAPLAGATCGACDAPLSPGAKFCHRCGTPAGPERGVRIGGGQDPRTAASVLPWSVGAIALVALIALVAGQQFGRSRDSASTSDGSGAPTPAPPFAANPGGGRPPDISNLSPSEAAARLYDRVMGAHERGQSDTVQLFAPMAIMAYQRIDNPDLDQRYDLGRIAAVVGDEVLARAQADTILARSPHHLLGLILAGNAARLRKDSAAERAYHAQLVAAVPGERAKQLPEYLAHENDITIALDTKLPLPPP